MAFDPLILRGNLKVNTSDVSAQVTSFKFSGARATIDVPATFGRKQSFAAGVDTYTVAIDFLQDVDSTALSMIFWDALASTDGKVTVSGSFESSTVSASNPLWSATAVVNAVGLGGAVNTVGVDSAVFPLTDRPTKAIV